MFKGICFIFAVLYFTIIFAPTKVICSFKSLQITSYRHNAILYYLLNAFYRNQTLLKSVLEVKRLEVKWQESEVLYIYYLRTKKTFKFPFCLWDYFHYIILISSLQMLSIDRLNIFMLNRNKASHITKMDDIIISLPYFILRICTNIWNPRAETWKLFQSSSSQKKPIPNVSSKSSYAYY